MHRDPKVICEELCASIRESFDELSESVRASTMDEIRGHLGVKPRTKAKPKQAPRPAASRPGPKPGAASLRDKSLIERHTKGLLKLLDDNPKGVKFEQISQALKAGYAELRWPIKKLKKTKQMNVTGPREDLTYTRA